MESHTYKLVDIVGTSPVGVTEAIQSGIQRAAKTLRHLDWFEVNTIRGQLTDGMVKYYQVEMKVGFRILEPEDLLKEA